VGDELREVVLIDELLWDGWDFDSDVFGAIERGAKVEVLDVEAGKVCVGRRNDAVEEEFGELEGTGFGTTVARVANAIATNGDAGAIRVILLGTNFTNHSCVRDIREAVVRDVTVVNGAKCIGTRDARLGGVCRGAANALAKAAKLVHIGGVPCCLVGRVSPELAVFKVLARGRVENWKGDGGKMVPGDLWVRHKILRLS
jgi:hypothetical protein